MSESSSDRRAEFEAQLAEVRVKTGVAETEQRWLTLGLVTAGVGVALGVIAMILAGGKDDTRDILEMVILGIVGMSLTIVGSAVFLRYSFARFLRFWMLRLLYEQQADD
jgi:hypothetical protein